MIIKGFTGRHRSAVILLSVYGMIFSAPARAQQPAQISRYFKEAFGSINAHIGICILNPATGKYVYGLDEDQYFTPASNTKIYSLYTALSFLGDSTSGIRYEIAGDTLYIQGTGDPSLLHPDYPDQPVIGFLQQWNKPIVFTNPVYENPVFGPGWPWDDYSEDYQPERSAMPVYGNVVWCTVKDHALQTAPYYFQKNDSMKEDGSLPAGSFNVRREQCSNTFRYNVQAAEDDNALEVPFKVEDGKTTAALLADTLHRPVEYRAEQVDWQHAAQIRNIPVDSLYQHMMYRSDNFFAEQVMQMCSDQVLGLISTGKMISYMLSTKLKGLPDKPSWVDGSGLSRYNLFTPRDMVFVLNRLYSEFPKERLYNIFPTGGKGTLENLYHDAENYIFAKTGSLSNNSALSGYLITKSGRTLIFSILVNNYVVPASRIRTAMEKFLMDIRNRS